MSKEVIEALKKIQREWASMSKEELLAHIEYHKKESCYPDNCDGSCQGAGGCPICDSFWEDMALEDEEDK